MSWQALCHSQLSLCGTQEVKISKRIYFSEFGKFWFLYFSKGKRPVLFYPSLFFWTMSTRWSITQLKHLLYSILIEDFHCTLSPFYLHFAHHLFEEELWSFWKLAYYSVMWNKGITFTFLVDLKWRLVLFACLENLFEATIAKSCWENPHTLSSWKSLNGWLLYHESGLNPESFELISIATILWGW